MNTNISNAALVATLYADSYDDIGTRIWFQKYNEKFAELIVKACAAAADMAQDANCKYAGDYVAEAMGYGQEEGVTEWRAK